MEKNTQIIDQLRSLLFRFDSDRDEIQAKRPAKKLPTEWDQNILNHSRQCDDGIFFGWLPNIPSSTYAHCMNVSNELRREKKPIS